jgi:hypothetical protein
LTRSRRLENRVAADRRTRPDRAARPTPAEGADQSGSVRLDDIRMIPETIRMQPPYRTVKKTYNLPPRLVARAKRVFKARTETEAIVRSLEDAVFMDDVARAIRATAGRLPQFRLIE